jgi:lipoprotein NlpI
MSKEQILKETMGKLQKLDKNNLKEASDFVDFLLTKVSNRELTKEIQKQAEEGKTFAFLNDEEELYTVHDLKEVHKK